MKDSKKEQFTTKIKRKAHVKNNMNKTMNVYIDSFLGKKRGLFIHLDLDYLKKKKNKIL